MNPKGNNNLCKIILFMSLNIDIYKNLKEMSSLLECYCVIYYYGSYGFPGYYSSAFKVFFVFCGTHFKVFSNLILNLVTVAKKSIMK